MSTSPLSPRIGIYGSDEVIGNQSRGCSLWPAGYGAIVNTAGGTPVSLRLPHGCSWDELLTEIDGVVFAENKTATSRHQAEEERLCEWCRELRLPLLAIDHGMHILNTTYGGTLYLDLTRDQPQALQHQRLPEPGDRHAIVVLGDTRLAQCYGEDEIVVNSEHRRAVCRVARGFRVSARALDGVIEAIEMESDEWYAVGVQWRPAAASASGLDIQIFRGLVEACKERMQATAGVGRLVAA
jgi:putative glutamine amidotransferase